MKLHLGVDAATGEITAHVLTDGHADDAAQVPDLLRQPEGEVARLTADGAYDGEPVDRAAAVRQPGKSPEVVMPPRSSAVLSTADPDERSTRDRHISFLTEHGRMALQRMTGYGRRNTAETNIGRYKHLHGLRARDALARGGEVALAVQVLNRMVREAKPVTTRRR